MPSLWDGGKLSSLPAPLDSPDFNDEDEECTPKGFTFFSRKFEHNTSGPMKGSRNFGAINVATRPIRAIEKIQKILYFPNFLPGKYTNEQRKN